MAEFVIRNKMKILLAADGSKFTGSAVKYLIKHRSAFGAKPDIHLVHVQNPLPARAAVAVGSAALRSYYVEESRRAMHAAARALKKKGIPYREICLVGDPGASIAAYAKQRKLSLILMGSHGQGAVSSFVLGSVVRKVLAGCKVPVLIVR